MQHENNPDHYAEMSEADALDFLKDRVLWWREHPSDLDFILPLLKHPSSQVRATAVKHGFVPLEIVEEFSQSDDNILRLGVAQRKTADNPKLQAETELTDEEWALRTPTPVSVLEKLANDPSPQVRLALADNHNTPAEVLRSLAEDVFIVLDSITSLDELHCSIVENPATPVDVLESFMDFPSVRVRKKLCYRFSELSETVLAQLVNDPDPEVRKSLAFNTDLPHDLTMQLVNDENILVLEGLAYSTTNTVAIELLSAHPKTPVRRMLARNALLPTEYIERLASDKNAEVRYEVAGRFSGDVDFHTLVKDPDEDVRAQVARNRRTPIKILHKILKEETAPTVISGVLENLEDTMSDDLFNELALKWFEVDSLLSRFNQTVLRSGKLTPETIRDLYFRCEDRELATLVARAENAPEDVKRAEANR